MEYTFTKFTGMDYLKIDIANNFGKDKEEWVDRLLWFQFNEDRLDSLVESADNPAQFFAGVQAYKEVMNGESTGYPISLDAVCSGLQWLSILSGDESAARLSCVIGQKRNDAYTAIYQYMVEALGESAQIQRDDTKQAIMTSLYGSTLIPKEIFGDGELYDVFINTMETHTPAAWELNQALIDMWNPNASSYHWVLPDNFHVNMLVKDVVNHTVHFRNFAYKVPVKTNMPTDTGRSLCPNLIHSIDSLVVREITRRCMYDPIKIEYLKELLSRGGVPHNRITKSGELLMKLLELARASGYMSSRVLDVIDKTNVFLLSTDEKEQVWDIINTLPVKPFEVFTIHDCFRSHPAYGNDLRWQYIHQMILISKSNMLSFLVSQIVGHQVTVDKYTNNLHEEIAKAEYPIC